ncbi:MAG: ABC transporter ATP-binding protein [Bryobacteraceae bacterium]|nr:ABC transporter ATP-binding protein [Bryobacteraceae bacterium]
MFDLRSVVCLRSGRRALSDVTARFAPGEFVALCGLNGAGKSTLLEVMAGFLPEHRGTCVFEGREVKSWNPRELARRVSFLPQSFQLQSRFTAAEVVRTGRHPFGNGWILSDTDRQACEEAMRLTGCEELRNRFVDELSGGERQRVLFAAVLAQQPAALLVDEPGTFVDLPHQIQMFRTIRDLCGRGMLCVAATHDLSLAAAFASRIILLHNGATIADASPGEVFPGTGFQGVFGDHIRIDHLECGSVLVHYGF